MIYRVVISEQAEAELEQAYRWLAERAPETAAQWYNGFLDALYALDSNPHRYPHAPENPRTSIEIRHLLYGRRRSFRAVFTVRGDSVVVLHIRHAARRPLTERDL